MYVSAFSRVEFYAANFPLTLIHRDVDKSNSIIRNCTKIASHSRDDSINGSPRCLFHRAVRDLIERLNNSTVLPRMFSLISPSVKTLSWSSDRDTACSPIRSTTANAAKRGSLIRDSGGPFRDNPDRTILPRRRRSMSRREIAMPNNGQWPRWTNKQQRKTDHYRFTEKLTVGTMRIFLYSRSPPLSSMRERLRSRSS